MKKAESRPKPISVLAEDRLRLARLSEEVMGRVEEMARIVSRTVGSGPKISVDRFTISSGTTKTPRLSLRFDHGVRPGVVHKFCYQNPPGICCPGDCPCPGGEDDWPYNVPPWLA